jgi:ribosomal protein S18 acetylase RimI-like enzyme
MNYSFDFCFRFGSIFYSEDKKACALILFPEQKKTDLKSILLDITFILSSLDFSHLKKAFGRGAKIKKLQLKGPASYLWFIGVEPSEQGRGVGSRLLQDVLVDLEMKGHPILLETSNLQNVNWYEKMGFTVYDQMDLGYILYFLKKEQNWSVRK